MPKQEATMAKNKNSDKTVGKTQGRMNPWGQYRKLPENVRNFQFKEIDGIKVLEEPSNHTATVIGCEGPALAWEMIQAMTYCQRSLAKTKSTTPVATVRAKFPMLNKYMEDDQIQAIACSEVGKKNARKEAVSVLAERLQIDPHTVERYFRESTKIARAKAD
jgi:hypothetical protein